MSSGKLTRSGPICAIQDNKLLGAIRRQDLLTAPNQPKIQLPHDPLGPPLPHHPLHLQTLVPNPALLHLPHLHPKPVPLNKRSLLRLHKTIPIQLSPKPMEPAMV
jgi:hypothetical protein